MQPFDALSLHTLNPSAPFAPTHDAPWATHHLETYKLWAPHPDPKKLSRYMFPPRRGVLLGVNLELEWAIDALGDILGPPNGRGNQIHDGRSHDYAAGNQMKPRRPTQHQ